MDWKKKTVHWLFDLTFSLLVRFRNPLEGFKCVCARCLCAKIIGFRPLTTENERKHNKNHVLRWCQIADSVVWHNVEFGQMNTVTKHRQYMFEWIRVEFRYNCKCNLQQELTRVWFFILGGTEHLCCLHDNDSDEAIYFYWWWSSNNCSCIRIWNLQFGTFSKHVFHCVFARSQWWVVGIQ